MLSHPQISISRKKGQRGQKALLIHGFTGTPDVMRPLANALTDKEFSVSVPLLAGHGGTPERLEKTGWQDWYATVHKALLDLSDDGEKIAVAGLSMGGLLALKLAIDEPNRVSHLACLATPIFLHTWIRWAMPLVRYSPVRFLYRFQKKEGFDIKDQEAAKSLWSTPAMPLACIASMMELQKIVRQNLAKIKIPTLVIHGRHDATAPYANLAELKRRLVNTSCETLTLENSYHLVTMDFERDLVAKTVTDFFMQPAATLAKMSD